MRTARSLALLLLAVPAGAASPELFLHEGRGRAPSLLAAEPAGEPTLGRRAPRADELSALEGRPASQERLAVLLADFQDGPAPPFGPEDARRAVIDGPAAYFREASYGKLSISGQVFGWKKLALRATCEDEKVYVKALEAFAADVDFRRFTGIVILYPGECGGGLSSLGRVRLKTPGHPRLSVIIIGSKPTPRMVAHELGHSFGLFHASRLACASSALSGRCHEDEYGDPFDVMGADPFDAHDEAVPHMNALYKLQLGWLARGQLPVAAGGAREYLLSPLETPAGSKAVLAAVRGPHGPALLSIEYRQPLGFDAGIRHPGAHAGGLLRLTTPENARGSFGGSGYRASGTKTLLLHADGKGFALAPGRSFVEPESGARVEVLGASREGLRVRVTTGL